MHKQFHLTEINTTAQEILEKLVSEHEALESKHRATVVALSGDLGAGKTTFTKSIAKHLGVAEVVTSPTFVIMKSYPTTHKVYKQLIHIDAYRLTSTEELVKLGWSKMLADPTNLIIVEWPEKVPEAIPDAAHRITLTHIDEEIRSLLHE